MRLVGVEGAVRVLSVRVSAELLAVMEGTNETSNAKFQARTSYLPQGERGHWLQDVEEIFS